MVSAHKERNKLMGEIVQAIRSSKGTQISFCEFMKLCLYHPTYGYYRTETTKIGKEGDFYTSSAVGGIFGELLARYFVRRSRELGFHGKPWTIMEWGGGSGRLAAQILDEMSSSYPAEYSLLTYRIVEQSAFHRRLAEEHLQLHRKKTIFAEPENWSSEARPNHVFLLSNELLDAFPVHVIRRKGGKWLEQFVAWEDNSSRFIERWEEIPAGSPLLPYIKGQKMKLLENQIAEISLAAPGWISEVGSWLNSGEIVTIDYGGTSEELYSPVRMRGTLLCYRKHVAHDDPFQFVGEQDMTAHVNFSACMEAGKQAGIRQSRLVTQMQFLKECGILDLLQEHAIADPFHPAVKRNRAVRQLLLSDQMSELFKVLIQTK